MRGWRWRSSAARRCSAAATSSACAPRWNARRRGWPWARRCAAIDISDGLLGDLGHVLAASGVGARLELDALPRSDVLAAQSETLQRECLLAGGDDYELVFTAPPGARLPDAGVALTRIGRIEAAGGLRVVDAQGEAVEHGLRSFDHFAA
jgi:thiamine-monophosphate kinase